MCSAKRIEREEAIRNRKEEDEERMGAAAATAMGAETATATANCSDLLQPPATTPPSPDRIAMNIIQVEEDDDIELNHGYNSDTEMSQKELVEEIKNLVQKSVEREIKKRTNNKRKRKGNQNLADDVEWCQDDNKAYSRYSGPYVYSVLQSIKCSEHRKALVKEMGFEHMLLLDDCNVPRLFAQWIANNTKPDEGMIRIGDKSIPISPKSFQDILGIPAGELPVETDELAGKAAFLELFGLSEIPTIRFFGDKIIKEKDMPDAEFSRCFMSVILGALLCPNSSTKPSTKYLGTLIDVDKINDRNWAKFAYDWFISYVTKYLKERRKQNRGTLTLGGCLYHIAVRYLDFVNFDSIKLPPTLPRIRVWKGKLIRHFSELDKGNDGKHGINAIKDFSETCYAAPAILSTKMADDPTMFKAEVERVVGEYMTIQVKDDIFHSFQSHMIDADKETYSNAQALLLDLLKTIVTESIRKPNSETTQLLQTQESTHVLDVDQDSQQTKRRRVAQDETRLSSNSSAERNINLETNVIKPNEILSKQEKAPCVIKDNTAESKNSVSIKNASTKHQQRSLSLNHTPSEDDGISSSFSKPIRKEQASKDNGNDAAKDLEEAKLDAEVDTKEEQVVTKKKDITSNNESIGHLTRKEYLKQASKKYYFKDSSLPSFRLFEHDNGKYIEEQELWRPLGANSQNEHENNEREEQLMQKETGNCSSNKEQKNYKNEEPQQLPLENNQTQAKSSYVFSPPKVPTPPYKTSTSRDFEFSSIQCAQRHPSYTFPRYTDNQAAPITEIEDLIDLDPMSPLSNSEHTRRINIAGKRLFQDFDSPMSTNKNLKQPMSTEVEFLYERSNATSPEVQFLGERSNRVPESSPEVQILGEKMFKNVCNEMARRSNDLYNAGLTLGSASVSTGKENIPPKRVIHPSHFLTSPFENNNRSIIQPHELNIYETLTTICNDPNYQDEWIINMNNCRVSLNQLGNSMKQNGWVEAWVINACCRKLFKDNHPRKSNKHFFFHTSAEYFLEKWPSEYMKNIWNKNVIKKFQAADSARKLHLSERLHFPALYNKHWFVFAVDIKTHNFMFLHSAFGERSTLHQKVDDMLIANFRKTWNECNLKDMHFENYGRVFPNLPKQKTPNDCGVFTIKYMQKYCTRNPQSCSFSSNDIPESRIRIAIDTLFNDYNSNIAEMDFISTFDLQAYNNRTTGP